MNVKYKKILPITKIANKINLDSDCLYLYGNDKAKIKLDKFNPNGNLILVTSTNPTPYGEGKTTLSIGINDALNLLNKKSIVVLREPSLGPVFGKKGGATGGGLSQVIPSDDINLHFTGDFAAIEACNNLLCAAIDNHIYYGNKLDINPDTITFHRCLDVNDRELRNIQLSARSESFDITAASEIMAILCLAQDKNDLRKKLENILIGYNQKGQEILASDLKIVDAMMVILKDAIYPNLVQTLENNPAIIHGGPFANIAHGCNSIIATKAALTLSDYVITEAGFGSDLGAEKFFNIKCRAANLKPKCIVINSTIKSLKHHGNQTTEIESLRKGLDNLAVHIENMLQFSHNVIVCLNKFAEDNDEEIDIVRNFVQKYQIPFSVSTAYFDGGKGAIEVAQQIIKICNQKNDFKLLYENNISIQEKINTICSKIYHTNNIQYTDLARKKLNDYESRYHQLPICIAKTPFSISDDPQKLGFPKNYPIHIQDIKINRGAGFIVVFMGSIMTMPGLPKKPNYEKIKAENDIIIGID